MKKIIVLLICMLVLSVGLLTGCIEEKNTNEFDVKTITVFNENFILERFNYSSDGLRQAIDVCRNSFWSSLFIPDGELIVYGKHGDTDCSFYFDNVSYLTLSTAGLSHTRFIVFENTTVFCFNNVSDCTIGGLNFTIVNDRPTVIDFRSGTNCSLRGVHIYQDYNISKFWYNKIQQFCNENPGVIV